MFANPLDSRLLIVNDTELNDDMLLGGWAAISTAVLLLATAE